MSDTELLLIDRHEEFKQHLAIVSFLEKRSGESLEVFGGKKLDRRHVAISKAGLLIHLYNIVEAVMVHQLDVVMRTLAQYSPSGYQSNVLREWIRQQNGTDASMNNDTRLDRSVELANILLGKEPVQIVSAPTASGNWDDKKIDKISDRLGCKIIVSDEVRRAARAPYFNEKSRMFYVKKKRNDLAHGKITFEEGGREKTLREIKDLSSVTLSYLQAVVASFGNYIENSCFLETSGPC